MYALTYPSTLHTLTLLSVPFSFLPTLTYQVPSQIRNSLYMALFQLPYIPELLLSSTPLLSTILKIWSPNLPSTHPTFCSALKPKLITNPTTLQNALHYYRANVCLSSPLIRILTFLLSPLLILYSYLPPSLTNRLSSTPLQHLLAMHPLNELRREKLNGGVRLLEIVGVSDGCVDKDMFKGGDGGRGRCVVMEGGGHWVHLENSGGVGECVGGFISGGMGGGKKTR